MLWLVSISASEIVDKCKENFENLRDYVAIMESKTPTKEGKEEYKLYRQKYMKPGYVYMEVIEGKNKGGVAVYNPKTQKVSAKKAFIKLTLSPDDERLKSPAGHRIYESHMVYFVERMKDAEFISEETLFGRKVYVIKVALNPDKNYGASYSKYWIDAERYIPIRVVDYSSGDRKVREVKFMNVKINVGLTEGDFKI